MNDISDVFVPLDFHLFSYSLEYTSISVQPTKFHKFPKGTPHPCGTGFLKEIRCDILFKNEKQDPRTLPEIHSSKHVAVSSNSDI